MSVTLKLADEDAAVVASILKRVSEPVLPRIGDTPSEEHGDYERWFRNIRQAHSGRDLPKLLEIAGAFQVAVRANQR